jgi:hypothetical protein
MRVAFQAIVAFVVLACAGLWASDRDAGTWKLNLAKSQYTADHPAPKSLTVTITNLYGAMVVDVVGEDATGKPIKVHYLAQFDGKDYPVTGADPVETVSVERIDANTIETTNKKEGGTITTVRTVVSDDGKTRTSTWTGTDRQGNPETWTAVYDKQ